MMQNTLVHPTWSSRSVLRYPGGKTRAVQTLLPYFPSSLSEMVSPFLGGGSIELALASRGVKVYAYDIFQPLVEFWNCLLSSPESLAAAVNEYYPLSKENFYQLQQMQMSLGTPLDRAAAYYVLNRASFSGATLSGGMSPEHPRFTPTSIERIKTFFNPNLSVSVADFETSLAQHPHLFAYLDPPYLIKSALYGKKGNAHKEFNHEALATMLRNRNNWILSYNDCKEIRDWYQGHRVLTPQWKYGMSGDKSSKEILIFSKDFS